MVEKKKFVAVDFSFNEKTFVVHSVTFSLNLEIYPFCKAQMASIFANNTFIMVFSKYTNFIDIFSLEFTAKFPEHIGINNYLIDLVNGQQPTYASIYSLELIEFKTLKTYIETSPANGFIWTFKLVIKASILFIWKLDGSLRLCVNYQGLNSFTIRIQYLLPSMKESLDQLG